MHENRMKRDIFTAAIIVLAQLYCAQLPESLIPKGITRYIASSIPPSAEWSLLDWTFRISNICRLWIQPTQSLISGNTRLNMSIVLRRCTSLFPIQLVCVLMSSDVRRERCAGGGERHPAPYYNSGYYWSLKTCGLVLGAGVDDQSFQVGYLMNAKNDVVGLRNWLVVLLQLECWAIRPNWITTCPMVLMTTLWVKCLLLRFSSNSSN
jgi:hypothetical protein